MSEKDEEGRDVISPLPQEESAQSPPTQSSRSNSMAGNEDRSEYARTDSASQFASDHPDSRGLDAFGSSSSKMDSDANARLNIDSAESLAIASKFNVDSMYGTNATAAAAIPSRLGSSSSSGISSVHALAAAHANKFSVDSSFHMSAPSTTAPIKPRSSAQFGLTRSISEDSEAERLTSAFSQSSGTVSKRRASTVAFKEGEDDSSGDSDDETTTGRRTTAKGGMRRRSIVTSAGMGESEFDRQAITSWIADMISFRIPTLMRAYIEAVLRSDSVAPSINSFVTGTGSSRRRLLFYYQKVPPSAKSGKPGSPVPDSERPISPTPPVGSPTNRRESVLGDGGGEGETDVLGADDDRRWREALFLAHVSKDTLRGTCVYFLRVGGQGRRLKVDTFLQSVTCGELRTPTMEGLVLGLSEVYAPVIAKPEWAGWGQCRPEEAAEMRSSLDALIAKFGKVAQETRKAVEIAKPSGKLNVDDGRPTADKGVLAHVEAVMERWSKQAEDLLSEQDSDNPANGLMDVRGPREEIDFWKTRLLRLVGFSDQLKLPECRQVYLVNSGAHTKAFRRWKAMEGRITEGIATTKDNVKHLSLLEPRLEKLYVALPTMQEISEVITPLMQGVQLLCVSAKFYQTSALLTQLLRRIVRQITMACKRAVTCDGNIWRRQRTAAVHDLNAAQDALGLLKEEYARFIVRLDSALAKQKQVQVDEALVFQDFDALLTRYEQLGSIFDAWSRYQAFADMQVDISGVKEVLDEFQELLSRLTHNFTRADVLDDIDKYGDFNRDVQIFNAQLGALDERLWKELEAAVKDEGLSMQDALDLMGKFEGVSGRDKTGAWKGMEKLYSSVLRRLLDRIRAVQVEYDLQKAAPPCPRNMPPVVGHILWAQQLQRRVHEAKASCLSMRKDVHSSSLFRKVMRVATVTEEALVEYMSRWFRAWAETLEITRSGLNATLLVKHPQTLQLCVNFDVEVLKLVREAKAFARAGFTLPEGAKRVLRREESLKKYNAELVYALNAYQQSLARIIPSLKPLLSNVLEDLEMRMQPGLTTLTWAGLNIDAFLHSITSAVASLDQVIDNVHDVVKNRIEKYIRSIGDIVLLDIPDRVTYTLGSGGIDKFIEDQKAVIQQRTRQMLEFNWMAERAVEEAVASVPSPYAFHTNDNHYLKELKAQYGYLAYIAVRSCVVNTLNVLKKRLQGGPTGLFYIERPVFDVDVELHYPNVAMVPSLEEVQNAINEVAYQAILATRSIPLWNLEVPREVPVPELVEASKSMHVHVSKDRRVVRTVVMLAGAMEMLKQRVSDYIKPFHQFDYLWKTDKAMALEVFTLQQSQTMGHRDKRSRKDMLSNLEKQESQRKVEHGPQVDTSSPSWLEALRKEMMMHWKVEQKINAILPVHNIGALSLDTVALKNSLKAEARAWKTLYGKQLILHAGTLITRMDSELRRISGVLTRPAKEVEEMIEVYGALHDAEVFDKQNAEHLGSLENILEWTTSCEVSGTSDVRVALDRLREGRSGLQEDYEVAMQAVRQDRKHLLSMIGMQSEELRKDTAAFKRDFLGIDSPIQPDAHPRSAAEAFQSFRPVLAVLTKRWEALHRAERATQLPLSDDQGLEAMNETLERFGRLFSLYEEVSGVLASLERRNMSELPSEMAAVSANLQNCNKRIATMHVHTKGTAAFLWMQDNLQRTINNLRILQDVSTSSMLDHHWRKVIAVCRKNSTDVSVAELSTMNPRRINLDYNSDEDLIQRTGSNGSYEGNDEENDPTAVSTNLLPSAAPSKKGAGAFLRTVSAGMGALKVGRSSTSVGQVLQFNLAENREELARISKMAIKEKEIREQLRRIDFEWSAEEFMFRPHVASSGLFVYVVDEKWAIRSIHSLQESLALLAIAQARGEEDDSSDSILHSRVVQWRRSLMVAKKSLRQLLTVQEMWTTIQCVYHDPVVEQQEPRAVRQFQVVEQQLFHILRQMRDDSNFIHYTCVRDVLRNVLPAIQEKLEVASRSLAGFFEAQRREFPRLYMVEDEDIIQMQYSCVNDPVALRRFLPLIFDGVHDVLWGDEGDGRSEESDLHHNEIPVFRAAGAGTGADKFSFHSPQMPARRGSQIAMEAARAPVVPDRPMTGAEAARGIIPGSSTLARGGTARPPIASGKQAGVTGDEQGLVGAGVQVPLGCTDSSDSSLIFVGPMPNRHETKIDKFLAGLLKAVQESVRKEMRQLTEELNMQTDSGVTMFMEEKALDEIVHKYSPQVVLMCLRTLWTTCLENVLDQAVEGGQTVSRMMLNVSKGLCGTLDKLLDLVRKVGNELRHKKRLATAVMLLMNLRDCLDALISNTSSHGLYVSDFAWVRQMRTYHESYSGNTWLSLLDCNLEYGYEWQGGAPDRFVLTPVSDRTFLAITQAILHLRGAAVVGPSGSGKLLMTQELGRTAGRYACHYLCQRSTRIETLERFLGGIRHGDSWVVLEDLFSALPCKLLSVVAVSLKNILTLAAIQQGNVVTSRSALVIASGPVVIALGGQGISYRAEVPESLRVLFRPITLSQPDRQHILQVALASNGVAEYASVARKLHAMYDLCNSHPMLNKPQLDWSLAGTMTVGRELIRMHQANPDMGTDEMLKMAMEKILQPRLTDDEQRVLEDLVSEVLFGGNGRFTLTPRNRKVEGTEDVIEDMESMHLHRNQNQAGQVLRLLQTYGHSSAIVLVGPIASGKSTVTNLLVRRLQRMEQNSPRASATSDISRSPSTPMGFHRHRALAEQSDMKQFEIVRIVPSSMSFERFFGYHSPTTGLWNDGVFAANWRACHRKDDPLAAEKTTLFILDGSLQAAWMDSLSSIIAGKELLLPNGERIENLENEMRDVKLIFETVDLANASPSWLGRCGFSAMDAQLKSSEWQLRAWEKKSTSHHAKYAAKQLEVLFINAVKFVSKEMSSLSSLATDPSVAMRSCLRILDSMLAEAVARGQMQADLSPRSSTNPADTELLDRLALFAVTWGVAGTAPDVEDRRKFTTFLRNSTQAQLPAATDEECAVVHDWGIDLDTGLWFRWGSLRPEEAESVGAHYNPSTTPLVVPTAELLAHGYLMGMLARGGHSVCLLGTPCCGKSLAAELVLDHMVESGNSSVQRISLRAATAASEVQRVTESTLQIQPSGSLAAARGGRAVLLLDDLHLAQPRPAECVWELLRQFVSHKGVYAEHQGHGDGRNSWAKIQGLALVGAMTANRGHLELMKETAAVTGVGSADRHQQMADRCLQHFVVVAMSPVAKDDMFAIASKIAQERYRSPVFPSDLIVHGQETIVTATIQFLESIQQTFSASGMRSHYIFELPMLLSIMHGLCLAPTHVVRSKREMNLLWAHECKRVACDRLISTEDRETAIRLIGAASTKSLGQAPPKKQKYTSAMTQELPTEFEIKSAEWAFLPDNWRQLSSLGTRDSSREMLAVDESLIADDEGKKTVMKLEYQPVLNKTEAKEFVTDFLSKLDRSEYQVDVHLHEEMALFLLRMRALLSRAKQPLILVEKEVATALPMAKLGAALASMPVIAVKDEGALTDSETSKQAAAANKSTSGSVPAGASSPGSVNAQVADVAARIAMLCAVERQTAVVICQASANTEAVLTAVTEMMDYGNVKDFLDRPTWEEMLRNMFNPSAGFGSPKFRGELAREQEVSKLVRKNLRVVVTVMSQSWLARDWEAIYHGKHDDLLNLVNSAENLTKRALLVWLPDHQPEDFVVTVNEALFNLFKGLAMEPPPSIQQLAQHISSVPWLMRSVDDLCQQHGIETCVCLPSRHDIYLHELMQQLQVSLRQHQERIQMKQHALERIQAAWSELQHVDQTGKVEGGSQVANKMIISLQLREIQETTVEAEKAKAELLRRMREMDSLELMMQSNSAAGGGHHSLEELVKEFDNLQQSLGRVNKFQFDAWQTMYQPSDASRAVIEAILLVLRRPINVMTPAEGGAGGEEGAKSPPKGRMRRRSVSGEFTSMMDLSRMPSGGSGSPRPRRLSVTSISAGGPASPGPRSPKGRPMTAAAEVQRRNRRTLKLQLDYECIEGLCAMDKWSLDLEKLELLTPIVETWDFNEGVDQLAASSGMLLILRDFVRVVGKLGERMAVRYSTAVAEAQLVEAREAIVNAEEEVRQWNERLGEKQVRLDMAMSQKVKMMAEFLRTKKALRHGRQMLSSLEKRQEEWRRDIATSHQTVENIVVRHSALAAFLAYASSLDPTLRPEVIRLAHSDAVQRHLAREDIAPEPTSMLLDTIVADCWRDQGLPNDVHLLESAIFVTLGSPVPFLVDPHGMSAAWLTNQKLPDSVAALVDMQNILLGRPNSSLYGEAVVPYVGLNQEAPTQKDGDASRLKSPAKQKRTRGMNHTRVDQESRRMAPASAQGKIVTVSIDEPQLLTTIAHAADVGSVLLVKDVDTSKALRRLPPELLLAPRRDNGHEHPRAASPRASQFGALRAGRGDGSDFEDKLRSSFHSLRAGTTTRSLIPHRSDVIRVGDSLINVHPMFRIVLSTSRNAIPEGLHGLNVVDFRISELGVEELLLNVAVTLDRPELAREKKAVASQMAINQWDLEAVHGELLKFLSQEEGGLVMEQSTMAELTLVRDVVSKQKTQVALDREHFGKIQGECERFRPLAQCGRQVHGCLEAFVAVVYRPIMQAPAFFVTALKSCLLDPSTPSGANRIASTVGIFRKELYMRLCLGLPATYRRLFAVYLSLSTFVAGGSLSGSELSPLCHLLAHAHGALPPLPHAHTPHHPPQTPSESGRVKKEVSLASGVSRQESRMTISSAGGDSEDLDGTTARTGRGRAGAQGLFNIIRGAQRVKASGLGNLKKRSAHAPEPIETDFALVDQPESTEWLPGEIWTELVKLSHYWRPLKDVPAAIAKEPDQAHSEWSRWYFSEFPETVDLPLIMVREHGEERRRVLRVQDRVLLIQVLRPDRLTATLDQLVHDVVGHPYSAGPKVEWDFVAEHAADNGTPIVCVERADVPLALEKRLQLMAVKRRAPFHLHNLQHVTDARELVPMLRPAFESGGWVVLTDVQAARKHVLDALLLEALDGGERARGFRLWLVTNEAKALPSRLLLHSLKVEGAEMCTGMMERALEVGHLLADDMFKPSVEIDSGKLLVSLALLQSAIVERNRYRSGWVESRVTYEDFDLALACVLKALSTTHSRSGHIDWRLLRCVLEVQYNAASANAWDGRLLAILIRRYFQRAVANPKHELFHGFAVAECPSRVGFFKVLRKVEGKQRLDAMGLSDFTEQREEQVTDVLVLRALDGLQSRPSAHLPQLLHDRTTSHQERAPSPISHSPSLAPSEMNSPVRSTADAETDRKGRRMSGEGGGKDTAKGGSFGPAAISARSDVSRWSYAKQHLKHGEGQSVQASPSVTMRSPVSAGRRRGSVQGAEIVPPLAAPPMSVLERVSHIMEELPQPIDARLAGRLRHSNDVMMQHLWLEIESFHAALNAALLLLRFMQNTLTGGRGRGPAADASVHCDMVCLMEQRVPPAWQAMTWPIADLDAWAHAMQTAQVQLSAWARDGYCKSYYLPALLRPHAFLTAVKLHQYRRTSSSSTEATPLEDTVIQLVPTKKVSPVEVSDTSVALGSITYVHGFELVAASLDVQKLRLSETSQRREHLLPTHLPILQVKNLSSTSAGAASEIGFECPCFLARPAPQPLISQPPKHVEAMPGPVDRPGAPSAAAASSESKRFLMSLILPIESPSDLQRWVLRGVHATTHAAPTVAALGRHL